MPSCEPLAHSLRGQNPRVQCVSPAGRAAHGLRRPVRPVGRARPMGRSCPGFTPMPMQVCELLHEVERASGLEMKELIARKEADVAELETHQCPPPCLLASPPPRPVAGE